MIIVILSTRCNHLILVRIILLETTLLWHLGDYFLNVFHSCFIAFNMFGWIFVKTRRVHFYALISVLFSWIGLGFWFGFGNCILTNIHWTIKQHLGQTNLPSSFISYFIQSVFGIVPTDSAVNILSYGFLALSLVMSVSLNLRDILRERSLKLS